MATPTTKKATATPERRPAPMQSNAARNPTHDEVARRAYELWLSRGGQHGRDREDWAQAERELRLGRQ